MNDAAIKLAVREHYARAAQGTCCGGDAAASCCETPLVLEEGLADIPSFGCGSPVEAADLQPGETVLDLGSGRGLDAFRAAQRVESTGRVIGVDMTTEMVWRAREDARRLGFPQAEFRLGEIEALPLPDASVDVVISNCVLNLIPDKARAFAEAFRVLRPSGRLVVADIVRLEARPANAVLDPTRWAACVDGAEAETVYLEQVQQAGFREIDVLARGEGSLYSLTVRARKPAGGV